ncbi:MAG: hypothetical protein K2X87_08755 [Gemmataceae bacterium]|nr:hypothetical protein [Gemmataceae bacterium]
MALRAWVRATARDEKHRDGLKAVADATAACTLTRSQDYECLAVLAAAYAECGRFAEAVKYQQAALALPGCRDRRGKEYTERVKLYQDQWPCRAVHP